MRGRRCGRALLRPRGGPIQERRAEPGATYAGSPLRSRLVAAASRPVGKPATIALVCVASFLVVAPPADARVRLLGSSVAPKRAFFDSGKGVRVAFRLGAKRPVRAVVRIRDEAGKGRSFRLGRVEPGVRQLVRWNGITGGGKAAANGRYRVTLRAGHRRFRLGGFDLHGHFFPVRGRHGGRGAIGAFGAPREGGRTHQGFDVTASCGTPLGAARAGRVIRRGYDPDLYGNFIEIKGRKEHLGYFYAHLRRPARPKLGEQVRTQDRLGKVGKTGNAQSVGCHLHFELHHRGDPIDPEPFLREWDAYS
jgi:murein DD-endopeptidase MepM/ murein hydrolase activator NlpD